MGIKSYIWYEKYRPKSLEELVLTPNYRKIFEKYIEDQNIPHLLLYGPAGSGKTTISNILLEKINSQSLVLNASSKDRGIDTIKGKVKDFASSLSLLDCLKIVFLDEADQLTQDAQKALRNTMETYSDTCRFILTGNYIDKILPEIQSRCTKFEFSSYPKRRVLERLLNILEEEEVEAKKEDLEALVDRLYPDMRSIMNNLQMGSMEGNYNPKISSIMNVDFQKIEELLHQGQLKVLRKSWIGMTEFTFLYRYLFDHFVNGVPEERRPEVALVISEYLYRDAVVVDREINFTACCMEIIRALGKKVLF